MVVDFEVASDFHCTRRADKSLPQIFLGARALKDSDCGAPLRTTELAFPEHHLNEVIHTATDGRNGLFTPLLSRLRFGGNSWRFAN